MAVSDGLLVRIQFLVQVQLTAIGTFRLHGLAVHPFEIIPPLFDGIDASVANLVVELGDPLAGEGQMNGHLQEEVVYEQPLVVVRTGFHAASASRTFGVSDTVADAAFRIRLPHFVAVEHHGVTPTYRITRALPRALEALLAHMSWSPKSIGWSWVSGMSVVTTTDLKRRPTKGLRTSSPMRLSSPSPA